VRVAPNPGAFKINTQAPSRNINTLAASAAPTLTPGGRYPDDGVGTMNTKQHTRSRSGPSKFHIYIRNYTRILYTCHDHNSHAEPVLDDFCFCFGDDDPISVTTLGREGERERTHARSKAGRKKGGKEEEGGQESNFSIVHVLSNLSAPHAHVMKQTNRQPLVSTN
jgi:hypothetical protein